MNVLQHSVPDWCFLKDSNRAAEHYRRLKAIGYQAVEMAAPQHWSLARAAGLEILNLAAPGMREGLNRTENHAKLMPEIESLIETAGENGIPQVIVLSGNSAGQAREDGFANCVTAMKMLVPHAERAGVTLVFEMLNTFNHADYEAADSRYGFDLVDAVGSSALRVLYDVYHMHRMGEDVVADIVNHVDLIAHLHVAGSPRRDYPGPEQEIDYARVVRESLAAGYRGAWGQEWLCNDDPYSALSDAARLFESYAADVEG